MRIDWQQSLEGLSLLEIRNLLRSLRRADAPFAVEHVAARLTKSLRPSRKVIDRAQRLIDGLIASGIVEPENLPTRSKQHYGVTASGRSLCAASATKRISRERADNAVTRLLRVVSEINADPIFLHDVAWVAVYGSYITDAPDLGDIDVSVKLKGRWTPSRGAESDSDMKRRSRIFEAQYPPPESLRHSTWRLFWPENYTLRLLRKVDRAITLVEPTTLETMGCRHRMLFPEFRDIPAKPVWSDERREVKLRPGATQE